MPAPPPPPSPSPPPPYSEPGTIVELLNKRFREGVPSNDLAKAGILVHQFDSVDDPNPTGSPWQPGAGKPEYGDRLSASLINKNMRADERGNVPIYSFSTAGLILSPHHNRMNCGYPYDVGSLGRACWGAPGCTPGCTSDQGDVWCARGHDEWPCAWRSSNLKGLRI